MTRSLPSAATRIGVVTGASSGIGRACLEHLTELGAVVEGWDLDNASLTGLPHGGAQVDVTDPVSVTAAADAVRHRYRRLDFVVNSAGIFAVGALADVSATTVRSLFDVNVLGTTLVTQSLLPLLRARGGAVVNITSSTALRATISNANYSASKAAVVHLTRCWALELAAEGIRVNAVAPGPIDTGLHSRSGMTAAEVDQLMVSRAKSIPLGRVGVPLDTARWVARLALDDEWVTGAVIPVDGGMSVG